MRQELKAFVFAAVLLYDKCRRTAAAASVRVVMGGHETQRYRHDADIQTRRG